MIRVLVQLGLVSVIAQGAEKEKSDYWLLVKHAHGLSNLPVDKVLVYTGSDVTLHLLIYL